MAIPVCLLVNFFLPGTLDWSIVTKYIEHVSIHPIIPIIASMIIGYVNISQFMLYSVLDNQYVWETQKDDTLSKLEPSLQLKVKTIEYEQLEPDKIIDKIFPITGLYNKANHDYNKYITSPDIPDWWKYAYKISGGCTDINFKVIDEILQTKTQRTRVKKEYCPKIPLSTIEIKCPWSPLNLIPNLSVTIKKCFTDMGQQIPLFTLLTQLRNQYTSRDVNHNVYLPGLDFDEHDLARFNGKQYSADIVPKFAKFNNYGIMAGIIGRSAGHHVYPNQDFFKKYKKTVQPEINRIIQQLKERLTLYEPLSIEQYVKHFPSRKRKAYARVLKEIQKRGYKKLDLTVEPNFKKQEAVYGPDNTVRPRIIWNPSAELKLIGGWINHTLIKLLKQDPYFVQGYSTLETAEHIQQHAELDDQHVWLAQDGSAHDSSQFAELRKFVDNQILDAIIPDICAKLNMEQIWVQEIMKSLISLDFNWQAKYDGKREGQNMATGIIHGTVLSGHPTQTTTFNTVRVHLMVYFLMHDCQSWQDFIAGDDMLLRLLKSDLKKVLERMKEIYSNDARPKIHGLGYLVKTLDIHDTKFNFLSKIGEITPQGVRLGRQVHRMIKGGNVASDSKINRTINRSMYNAGIVAQLKHQGGQSTVIQQYLQLRSKLTHNVDGEELYKQWQQEEYNNHTTSEDRNWWDSYEALELSFTNPWISSFEHTQWWYEQIDNFKMEFTESKYKQMRDDICKRVY